MIKKLLCLIFLINFCDTFSLNVLEQDQSSILEKFLSNSKPSSNMNQEDLNISEKTKQTPNTEKETASNKQKINDNLFKNSYQISPLIHSKSEPYDDSNNDKHTSLDNFDNDQNSKLNSKIQKNELSPNSTIEPQSKNDQNKLPIENPENLKDDVMNETQQVGNSLSNATIKPKNSDVDILEKNLISSLRSLRNTKNYKNNQWDKMNEFNYNNHGIVNTLPKTEMKIPVFKSEQEQEEEENLNVGSNNETNQNEYATRTRLDDFIFGNLSDIMSDFSSKARKLKNIGEFDFERSNPFFN